MKSTLAHYSAFHASRRKALQYICAGIMASGGLNMLTTAVQAAQGQVTQGQVAHGQGRLIVYYSRSGNTRAVAKQIHATIGGDLLEIQTVHPYPEEYRATTDQAKKELAEGYKPPLATKVPDMQKYALVFLGSPNWWGTIAPPVMTFLSEYDFSGKTIAPFITHGGGGAGRSTADIRKLCPKASVAEALAISGRSAASAQKDVAAWLAHLGLKA